MIGLQMLQVNWTGVLLIALTPLLFIGDVRLRGYGALTLGGIAGFFMGSLLLFPQGHLTGLTLSREWIGAAAGFTAFFLVFIVGNSLRNFSEK